MGQRYGVSHLHLGLPLDLAMTGSFLDRDGVETLLRAGGWIRLRLMASQAKKFGGSVLYLPAFHLDIESALNRMQIVLRIWMSPRLAASTMPGVKYNSERKPSRWSNRKLGRLAKAASSELKRALLFVVMYL
ncbi:MAG TPA: hypothetical protein VFG56_02755 [Candidatus Saccharimonadales bacterium]|nr:hypothetical protein [Candidatus Saccharimonadales bacterium]